ncbi:discoidin domain-containing protein [Azospirillum sp. B21]|uniref:discoidin domain-containing protein n=1 Tax=Azospirillum sp. B21 TaxID=2607496 RepID=UPI0011EDF8C2|nr:discoidin domain-containing protein [Azospirillum sp. B21]KAA0573329.1 discoidin domain-containing protein [Azospirillum sp. B21]
MLINPLSMSATLPTRRGWSAFRMVFLSRASPTSDYVLRELRFLSGSAQLPGGNMEGDNIPAPLVASASSYSSSNFPWKAFDGTYANFWSSSMPDSNGQPWLQVYLGPQRLFGVNGVYMNAEGAGAAPTAFQVLGSQDLATWTLIGSVSGLSWSDNEEKVIKW